MDVKCVVFDEGWTLVGEAERRHSSQLMLLDDAAFERGLAVLRNEIAGGSKRVIQGEFGLLSLIAVRP